MLAGSVICNRRFEYCVVRIVALFKSNATGRTKGRRYGLLWTNFCIQILRFVIPGTHFGTLGFHFVGLGSPGDPRDLLGSKVDFGCPLGPLGPFGLTLAPHGCCPKTRSRLASSL